MPDHHSPDLSTAELRAIDSICEAFENSAQRGGLRRSIEQYLDEAADSLQDVLFLELLAIEVEQNTHDGTQPSMAEYESRFPDRKPQVRHVFDRIARQRNANVSPWHETANRDSRSPAATPTGLQLETIPVVRQLPQRIGRFRIESVIGQGGFGIVYQAHDDRLDRTVAIKVPLARTERPEDLLAEARTVARLDHPNIVPVYEVGSSDEFDFYIVSRYIDGTCLAQGLQLKVLGDPLAAAETIATVADALQYAHEQGLVHRDVKPGNILIDKQGQSYLADFGLAMTEEKFGHQTGHAGTPAYMSPEQARGEGHHVDGRSDIFSLGVVFYQWLTGRRPFRGSTASEVMHQVATLEPRPPRQYHGTLPAELERICLKAMSKRTSMRYLTARDMAVELRAYLAEVSANNTSQERDSWSGSFAAAGRVSAAGRHSIEVVPRGLRSFDSHDRDFFLGLLPGPRDRTGLPNSIRFWKTQIEETDEDQTFSVGLIYGPSGCGKSSLVKAGLVPQLSSHVTVVYIESAGSNTQQILLHRLRRQFSELPPDQDLRNSLAALRRDESVAGRKVLIIIDQFEQWLHESHGEENSELVQALRQCDGRHLQCLLLVRDEFWLAVSRLMLELDVNLVPGHNVALVDVFEQDHARNVLAAFGRAFGKLPLEPQEMSQAQVDFLNQAICGLADEDGVVCVRLALFAEMLKKKEWVPEALKAVGGTEGVGVAFLDETFNSRLSNPNYRLHQKAARAVLKELLPDYGTDIKGTMRSYAALMDASGYGDRPQDFDDLINILDSEIRLITPTDPDGRDIDSQDTSDESTPQATKGQLYFELTHDYLVHSLRDWLTRKQKETASGRAELKLFDHALLWNAEPKNRFLPSLLEWVSFRTLTQKHKWTLPQQKMMAKAGRFHGFRVTFVFVALLSIVFGGLTIRDAIARSRTELIRRKEEEREIAEATQIAKSLLQAETSQVKAIIENLDRFPDYAREDLINAFADSPEDSNARLHAALGMLSTDPSVLPFLKDRLLTVDPQQFAVVRDFLEDQNGKFTADYWEIARNSNSPALRFQSSCALATYDPTNTEWENTEFCKFLAEHLVSVQPSDLLPWRNALRGVKTRLTSPLAAIYRDDSQGEKARDFATETLCDYFRNDVAGLFDLLADANDTQFETMFALLVPYQGRAIALGNTELAKTPAQGVGQSERETLAMRQASAAVMLLRMNAPEQVWPLLKHSPDPQVRSYLIDRISSRGSDPNAIIARYEQETDVSIKRALLLCLGGFDVTQLPPAQRDRLCDQFADVYRNHPDAGIHGAARWMLTKWGKDEQIVSIDQELRQSEEQRQNATDDPRQWFVNGQGQTFVILEADQIPWIMSIPDEANVRNHHKDAMTREEKESLGWYETPIANSETRDWKGQRVLRTQRRIQRRFAIATTEVTKAQFDAFEQTADNVLRENREMKRRENEKKAPSEDHPLFLSWFQAAHYCNWLSASEGIPEDQWCYEKNAANEYHNRMRAKDDFLELQGYRLPTEAEWQFACAAGAITSRYWGDSETLSTRYAWCESNADGHSWPVASLKPNDFGLFDMHGNLFEHCFDHYLRDLVSREDSPSTLPFLAEDCRVSKGSSYLRPESWCYTGQRSYFDNCSQRWHAGFRPVRTIFASNASTDSPGDSNTDLHAALETLSTADESVLPFLQQQLLTVSAQEFQLVRDSLEEHQSIFMADYWEIAKASDSPALRFQAACALATYDPTNTHWQNKEFCKFLARHLVSVKSADLLSWCGALRPVKARLAMPLAAIYRDDTRGQRIQHSATRALCDFLSDDVDGLFNLLADANEKQFETMFALLVPHRDRAIDLGNAELAKTPAPGTSQVERDALAMRQANIAVMLPEMDAPEQVSPLLKHRPDPRVRSYLIDRISSRGSDPSAITARYEQETDVSIKRALLLCLGGFDVTQLPPEERERLCDRFFDVYRNHPDAGIHGAVRWMLTKWGKGEQIVSIDQELRQSEEQLQTAADSPRQWYVNGQGQTFVILDADQVAWKKTIPNEMTVNSHNKDVMTREDKESLGWHDPPTANAKDVDWKGRRTLSMQRRIGRRLAVAATEVTKAQRDAFDSAAGVWTDDREDRLRNVTQRCRTEDCPIPTVTWFEAAWYCNWLSECEGIPEDQWCYQPNADNRFHQGIKAKDNFLELRGYRLPTEAEWEFASRAGTTTMRYYGEKETLLPRYAWVGSNDQGQTSPVASLKPNDFGLFDMYGNLTEYCFDHSVKDLTRKVDSPGTHPISTTDWRVSKGSSLARPGTWSYTNASVHWGGCDDRPGSGGFRPVRTCFPKAPADSRGSKKSAEH